jgi:hypothetical protein
MAASFGAPLSFCRPAGIDSRESEVLPRVRMSHDSVSSVRSPLPPRVVLTLRVAA